MKDINFFDLKDSFRFALVRSKDDLGDLNFDGTLIRGGEKFARSVIASLKDKGFKGKVGFVGGDDSLNRRAIETLNIDYLVSPEVRTLKDTLKQRDSGLNHVVCKIAKEKGVAVVVDMGEVARLRGKEKALRLSKIMQNVKIARNAGCKILIGSFGKDKSGVFDLKGRKAFGESLGMNSQQVRDCVGF
jgi:RNase P/RNase MRP subunit p30